MDERTPGERGAVSRRTVLTGGGAAIVGGLVAGTATTVAGSTAASAGGNAIAMGPPGTTVLELVFHLTQNRTVFTGFGYVTGAAGLTDDDLFSDPAHRDVAHALFVATARGELVARAVEGAVHSLDIAGELRINQRSDPGASWANGASFTAGRLVARFALELQDVLTVIAPNTGLPVLNGAARQTNAESVRSGQFGQVGRQLRFTATGLGNRTDPGLDLNQATAELTVAGALIAV
jgi:hypothetical protein